MESYFIWTPPLPSINTDVVYGFLKAPPSRNLPRHKSQARRPLLLSVQTLNCINKTHLQFIQALNSRSETKALYFTCKWRLPVLNRDRERHFTASRNLSKKNCTEDPNKVWVNGLPTVSEVLGATGDTIFQFYDILVLLKWQTIFVCIFPQYFSSKKEILTESRI